MTEGEALASGAIAVAVKLESLFKRWYEELDDDPVWLEASEKEWSFAEFLAAGLVMEIPEVFAVHERDRIREELEKFLEGERSKIWSPYDLRQRFREAIAHICPEED